MTFANRVDTILEAMERGRDLLDTVFKFFPSIKAYLAKFDITLSKLRKIGEGGQGVAYSDKHKVVKVTEDKAEALASKRVLDHGPIIGVNTIIGVAELTGTFQWHPDWGDIESQFYIIVQDLQGTKLSKIEKEVADFVGDFLCAHYHDERSERHKAGKGLIYAMSKYPATEASVEKLGSIAGKAIQNHRHTRHKFLFTDVFGSSVAALTIATRILEAVIRLYYYADVRFFDVQDGNIGKDRDGNYVIFDLGVSKIKGDIPALDLLQAGLTRLHRPLMTS